MLQVSGYWLIGVGVLHALLTGWQFADPLMDMVQAGWFNAVTPYPLAPYDREDALWCMMMTPFLLLTGRLCCWAQTNSVPLPAFPGWVLLLAAVVGITLEPISGFWLLIPPALLILANSYNRKESLGKAL